MGRGKKPHLLMALVTAAAAAGVPALGRLAPGALGTALLARWAGSGAVPAVGAPADAAAPAGAPPDAIALPVGALGDEAAAAVALGTAPVPEAGARVADGAPGTGGTGGTGAPGGLAVDRYRWLERHYAYIMASQRPTGAIAMTPAQLDINPYFANRAARALLTEPRHLPAVEAYMDWYLAHLNPDGTIDDHRVEAGREVSLGRYDSADSYAATFLTLVEAYLQAGGDPEWVVQHRSDLDRLVGLLIRLTDPEDGLTWAKPHYPFKLLMDNVEVWEGLQAWARVLEAIGEPAAAAGARERADRIHQGLSRFRRSDGVYAWGLASFGLRRGGNLQRFYPDAVAQFFPLALGLTDDPAGYEAFAAAHPAWHRLESDRFPWMMAAVAAARAGDWERVAGALAAVADRYVDLPFPWYVGESAWLIDLLRVPTPELVAYWPAPSVP